MISVGEMEQPKPEGRTYDLRISFLDSASPVRRGFAPGPPTPTPAGVAMATYTFSTKPMSRKQGRNAVAAAAYRSGAELADERTGVVHDYTRKRGIVHTEIIAAAGITPPDREQLWNAAEAVEKRRDARVAREYLVALPHELDANQRLALARELAGELVERYGVAVDLAVHAPDPGGDQRNHHAHLLATTRRLNHDGLGEKASIELSDKKRRDMGLRPGGDEVKLLRQRWESMANAALERADIAARIDCRSLADQGIDRLPQIHRGPMATEQIRRGTAEQSERALLSLEIDATNAQRQHLREQLDDELAVQEWAEITPTTPHATPLELPEPVTSPAADAELAQARESARMDSQERVEQNIADRHQLQIRGERRALERAQARVDERRDAERSLASQRQALVTLLSNVVTAAEELEALRVAEEAEARSQAEQEAVEQREWQAWISHPEVGSDGRIIEELAVEESCRRSWEESQQIEAAEREASEVREAIADAEAAQAEMDALAEEMSTEIQERPQEEPPELPREVRATRVASASGAGIAQRLLDVQVELRTAADEYDRAQVVEREAAQGVQAAQAELDEIRGLFKVRQRREARQRLDAAQERHQAAQLAAQAASERYVVLSHESERLRERAAAGAVSIQNPHRRVEPRTEELAPTHDTTTQRQSQRTQSRRRDDGPGLGS